jgi:hypothetical protein
MSVESSSNQFLETLKNGSLGLLFLSALFLLVKAPQ